MHDDLVRRNFTTDGPNRLWLTDIAEHPTSEGELYLCAIKDVFSKRIVGYSVDHRMKSRLAVAALDNAVARVDVCPGCSPVGLAVALCGRYLLRHRVSIALMPRVVAKAVPAPRQRGVAQWCRRRIVLGERQAGSGPGVGGVIR
ncbi:DDE-type integrase/transposase/recombinase [Streptomyces sp. H27-D2]|uniref:DDE-type integrase/transposase/recombinase n=1 Tax=Streptomyces sp. H27-D2 TaxID=3046304 RepID=UPI002DBF2E5D|nr:DDE-type integrase/transposase/recombinase [Streptomyces sp. H27-D2]MEC4020257.1 DDE-type integrase/transposase/recombinase [Streptomyces sp. H27-D2]